jgi:ABC-type multidrug transport system fused ATPase/permease subunit
MMNNVSLPWPYLTKFGHSSLLTSSTLPPESEEIVQRSIDILLKQSTGITTVIVAHRLRTVRNADVIVCVKDGKIAEIGSHDQLMMLEYGYYREMVAKSTGDKLVTD